jgi:hypothetical protein
MRITFGQERGSAMLITLVVMLLVSTAALMAVKKSTTDMTMSYNQVHEEQAFYVAEAGAKQAVAQLDANTYWKTGYSNVRFGEGHYSVNVLDSNDVSGLVDTMLVVSRGEANRAVAEVEISLLPDFHYPFAYAMFADKGIHFDRATCTDSWDSDSGSYAATQLDSLGSVGSNGTISSSKDVIFGGDISSATPGGLGLGAGNIIHGDSTSSADSVDLNIVPDEEYAWAAANTDAPDGLSGSNFSYDRDTKALVSGHNSNVVLAGGVYFFSSIFLGQNSNLTVADGEVAVIYMTGDITFNQGSTLNDYHSPSDLMIYSQGSLNFNQDNKFYGTFYGPNGHIQYDQTTEVYGSIVGSTIRLDQGACFHYDRALGKIKRKRLTGVTQVAWRELDR